MNKHFTSRAVLFALVASLSGFASAAHAESFVPEVEPAGCPADAIDDATPLANKTPMCNYLEKCCAGNTPNREKCCAGLVKHCGG